ncbi:MAG: phage holin family protein [Bacteroidota bacterium]
MEEKIKVEHLISDVKEYAEERMNLVMLTVQEKTSKAIASTASVLIVVILAIFMLGFLSTALAWFIGQQLAQPFLGFLIVGGVYLIAAILLWSNREKWIGFPVMNAFLKNISDDED